MRNSEEIKEITERIAKQVWRMRLEKGWSREQLSKKIGVTHQQTQKYEKGTNRITAARLELIAKAFKVPVADFYEECDYIPNDHQRLTIELVRVFSSMSLSARVGFVNLMRTLKEA